MSMRQRLEQMLAAGQDNALLRFSLGELRFKENAYAEAARHLAAAVAFDADYSAAWKLYGRVLLEDGAAAAAADALARGIEVAERRGDNQAASEMRVFLKRARSQLDATR